MEDVIKTCTDNSQFIMVCLTFIYVIATIVICYFNYKSASNLIKTQKQSIDLQLFRERRKIALDIDEYFKNNIKAFLTRLDGRDCEIKEDIDLYEIKYVFGDKYYNYYVKLYKKCQLCKKSLHKISDEVSKFHLSFYKDESDKLYKKYLSYCKDYNDGLFDKSSFINFSKKIDCDIIATEYIHAKELINETKKEIESNRLLEKLNEEFISFI